jgi:hypothetical protein
MNNDTIGVDVSKAHLDAHRLADGASRRFANDKRGHGALIKWLAETPTNRRKACETCGLTGFEGAEFGHFGQQGEGALCPPNRGLVRSSVPVANRS